MQDNLYLPSLVHIELIQRYFDAKPTMPPMTMSTSTPPIDARMHASLPKEALAIDSHSRLESK
jgi:hypothetical protein